MATILIRRKSGSVADAWRPYRVIVDGCGCGDIRVGECVKVIVPPGERTIRFDIDFYSSRTVKVHMLEQVAEVQCQSSTRRWLGLLAAIDPNSWISVTVKELAKDTSEGARVVVLQDKREHRGELPAKLTNLIARAHPQRRGGLFRRAW